MISVKSSFNPFIHKEDTKMFKIDFSRDDVAAFGVDNVFEPMMNGHDLQIALDSDPLSMFLRADAPRKPYTAECVFNDDVACAQDVDDICMAYDELANESPVFGNVDQLSDEADARNIDDVSDLFDSLTGLDEESSDILDQVVLPTESEVFPEQQTKFNNARSYHTIDQNVHCQNPFMFMPPVLKPFNNSLKGELLSLVPDAGNSKISPKPSRMKYVHDPETCDICHSSKTPERKRILHRFREKRHRRNWSRGPRYTARSSVAYSRTRTNGRFVALCKWE